MSTQFALSIRRLSRGLLALPLLVIMLVAVAPAAPAAPSEPYLVKDIVPGSGDSQPSGLVEIEGTLFFAADDGTHGEELWKSDGTAAGTVLVKDINPGSGDSLSFHYSGLRTGVDGTLFFAADDGTHGWELWKSDGTAAGTVLVKDINPGSGDSPPRGLTGIDGTLFFEANDGTHGGELWKSDGTAANTTLVKDIYPRYLTEFKGELFFSASDTDRHDGENLLWKSDGTETGTVLVRDNTGSSVEWVYGFQQAGGTLFIKVDLDASSCDAELWKTDGTEAGTMFVKDLQSGEDHALCLDEMTAVGDELFFSTNAFDDACSQPILWKSDGTEQGTVSLREFTCDEDDYGVHNLTEMNGKLFFASSQDLGSSDGTESGTVLYKLNVLSWGSGMEAVDSTLFFGGRDETHGDELWKSDGSPAGTELVGDINPGESSSVKRARYFTDVRGTLFFPADDGTHGVELWALDTGSCSPPAKPIQSTPAQDSSTCDATPEFEWKPVTGAKEYQIRIADGDTSSIVIQTETRDTTFRPDTPLSPGTYFWRVRASNNCDWSAWSEKWWFTVQPPPPVPELSSPVDGSRTYETRPIFEWSATKGANRYRLQVDDDASFASPVIDKTKSGTSYRPSDPLSPGTYHWRVRGSYDCGKGAWSTAYRLTLLPTGLEYEAYLPLVRRAAR